MKICCCEFLVTINSIEYINHKLNIDSGPPMSAANKKIKESNMKTFSGNFVFAIIVIVLMFFVLYSDKTEAASSGSSNAESALGDSGSTGTVDNNISGNVPKEYFDPTDPLTPKDSTSNNTSAVPPAEKDSEDLFGPLDKSADTATAICSSIEGSGGILPCGKNVDDPSTAWNECNACDLCSMVLMGQITITFLIKIAAFAAALAIAFAGYVYVFAVGKEELIRTAKEMIKYSLIGVLIIFLAWAIVDSVLSTLGYIDPMGDSWYTVC